MPIFSEAGRQWISTRTDQDIAWDDLCIPTIDFPYPKIPQVVDCEEFFVPSEKSVCLLVMKFYFESSFRLAFPVLDQVLFDSTVQAAFEGESSSPRTVKARACVLAALSIAGRRAAFEIRDTDTGDENSDKKHYVEAHQATAHLLLLDISEEISLDALQATIILVCLRSSKKDGPFSTSALVETRADFTTKQLLHMCKGRWRAAAYYNSSACRMVCSLGGHIYEPEILEDESSLAKREKNHTRTLFWLCYMLDKDISLRTGNPPLLTETYSDLTTPMHFSQYYNHLPTAEKFIEHWAEKNISLAPHFLGESQLSYLKEKVCRRLFSAPALKNNDDQLLLHIRELDDEVESWRLSVPTAFRPALSVSQKNLSDLSEITDPEESDPEENEPSRCMPYIVRRMSLQLEYHHLMTIIHTAVRKCKPNATNATEDLHDVVHSSFDLALVASKSTLSCLKFLVDTIKEESYPYV